MNIIFFGNGNFSLKSLEYLHINSQHNIMLVVTNDAKKQGRGLKEKNTPVSNYANQHNIKQLKTNNINDIHIKDELIKYDADLFVVIEYKILPESIFSIPRYGSINIHGSILPKYRGAAPIQRAIMNGDEVLGVSCFKINSNIDEGDIICTKSKKFELHYTYGQIYKELSVLGAELLLDSLNKISKNKKMVNQDQTFATKAPKINRNEYNIHFKDSSINVHNKIRALTPPGAYAIINSKKIKLIDTSFNNENDLNIGEHKFINNTLHIGCDIGTLIVKNFQFESKNKISAKDFSNLQHLKKIKFE